MQDLKHWTVLSIGDSCSSQQAVLTVHKKTQLQLETDWGHAFLCTDPVGEWAWRLTLHHKILVLDPWILSPTWLTVCVCVCVNPIKPWRLCLCVSTFDRFEDLESNPWRQSSWVWFHRRSLKLENRPIILDRKILLVLQKRRRKTWVLEGFLIYPMAGVTAGGFTSAVWPRKANVLWCGGIDSWKWSSCLGISAWDLGLSV